jgi:hypothetical protein
MVDCPNKPGIWKHMPTGDEIDVYSLDPVGGMLCLWGPEVGLTQIETMFWADDEWVGHVPVHIYGGPWTFIKEVDNL